MKTLQNGELQVKVKKDGSKYWAYQETDGTIILFKEANIVAGHNLVYRASSNMQISALKSTIRKNRSNLGLVASSLPGPMKFNLADSILSEVVGYDYERNRKIPMTEVLTT